MIRTLSLLILAAALTVAPANAAPITGQYIEARTCDVWTGPCFANAEVNLGGKHAVMGWMIEKGSFENVKLDGLNVVAVVAASDTLGVEQTGAAKAVLIVDKKATSEQRDALVRMARSQAGALLKNVVKVEASDISFDRCPCKSYACAILNAGNAKIETRCLGRHDTICGNESAFYPPLVKNVKATAAVAQENTYKGNGIRDNWKETGRRSAYVGSFEIR
jgi:hypothetical protein